MMWYLIFIPSIIYCVLVFQFVRGWLSIKVEKVKDISQKVTIIIACRNESNRILNLLKALDNQNFNFKNLEIIIVDDHSIDDTLFKIQSFKGLNYFPKVLSLKQEEKGKKAAIKIGIDNAQNDIMVLTDADCQMGSNWLKTVISPFESDETKMVTGPVMFFEKPGFWNQLVQLDFISLIGIGASSLQNGNPNMCNGANIAYRKSAFYEVNGFDGNEHLPSGDDEFLLHKIFDTFNGSVRFVKNEEAIVYTEPPKSFDEFLNQRLRWGSKAKAYKNLKQQWLPAFVYLFNMFMFCSPILLLFGMPWLFIAALWIIKLGVEILFFTAILPFFKSSKLLDLLIPAQFLHVMYITVIGVLSVVIDYRWKQRKSSDR